MASKARYWTRFSFTEESNRVVSMFTKTCPGSTTCPSCTRISETIPPSRLCRICNCLEGMTLPSPFVISSTSESPAHKTARIKTTPRLLTSILARNGSCASMARSASPPNPASMRRSSSRQEERVRSSPGCNVRQTDSKPSIKGRAHAIHRGFMRLSRCDRL